MSYNPLKGNPKRIAEAEKFVKGDFINPHAFYPDAFSDSKLDVTSTQRYYLLEMYYNFHQLRKQSDYVINYIKELIKEAKPVDLTATNPWLKMEFGGSYNRSGQVVMLAKQLLAGKKLDLMSGFTWNQTPEGSEYWNKRHSGYATVTDEDRETIKKWILVYLGAKL